MTEITKPLPITDGDSKIYWEGCKEGKLLIQYCTDCDNHIFYPRTVCPHCMSDHIEWVEAEGKGKVYTYTIARRGAGPAFADDAPYVVALIELEEGVRLISNVINCNVDDVYCDMEVQVVFEKVGDFHLPKYKPV